MLKTEMINTVSSPGRSGVARLVHWEKVWLGCSEEPESGISRAEFQKDLQLEKWV